VNLEAINFEEVSYLKGTLRIWPAGEIGSALVNTGVAQRALKLNFDSLNETAWQIPAKQFIGSRTFEISLNNSSAISNYPFDAYRGSWRSFLEDFQSSLPLASTLTVSERPIYGWEMSVEPIELPNDIAIGKTVNLDGKQAFEWSAHRSGSIKLSFTRNHFPELEIDSFSYDKDSYEISNQYFSVNLFKYSDEFDKKMNQLLELIHPLWLKIRKEIHDEQQKIELEKKKELDKRYSGF
jgi:hypothetical protein